MSHVDLKKYVCRPVEFKKCTCRPVRFRKLINGHVALLNLRVTSQGIGVGRQGKDVQWSRA